MYNDPPTVWPPSLTDPSQNISIQRLINDYLSRGAAPLQPQNMAYGVDMSRLDFTTAHSALSALDDLKERRLLEMPLQEEGGRGIAVSNLALKDKVLAQLKAGTPELQAIAADLTRILPGFEEVVPPK